MGPFQRGIRRDAFRWSHRKAIPATAVEITASLSHSSSLRFP